MGFKLEMELEHGKQLSWLAAEPHVCPGVAPVCVCVCEHTGLGGLGGGAAPGVVLGWEQTQQGTHSSVVKHTRRRKIPLAF